MSALILSGSESASLPKFVIRPECRRFYAGTVQDTKVGRKFEPGDVGEREILECESGLIFMLEANGMIKLTKSGSLATVLVDKRHLIQISGLPSPDIMMQGRMMPGQIYA